MTQYDNCKACGARIIWARNSRTLAPAAIDADPGHGWVWLHGPDPQTPLYTVLTPKQASTKDMSKLHSAHDKTCPYARRQKAKQS